MRADRLVSLVLLLRQRGRMTAEALAAELEVSSRTILRDIEALSTAGVPVYAERGRHGGFMLLPGFRTELAGLTPEEALALLTAQSGHDDAFGLGPSLASALRKVLDALPDQHQATASDASRRLLVDPEVDLLSRRQNVEPVPPAIMSEIRQAVLTARRLRINYQASGEAAQWRIVDPLGLVTVRGRSYLLALRSGADRTYRLSRVLAAQVLPEPAERPPSIDLDLAWQQRVAQFLSEDHLVVRVLVAPAWRDELLDLVESVRAEQPEPDGRFQLEVTFQDLWHAEWALWRLGTHAEALEPPELRTAMHRRALQVASRYADATGPDGD